LDARRKKQIQNARSCITKRVMVFVCLAVYCSSEHIKDDEMGGECGTHGRKEMCMQVSGREA
jgi:hypothetical protein